MGQRAENFFHYYQYDNQNKLTLYLVAACSLFGLQAGGFKTQGVLLVELAERFEGIYPISTLIWVVTVRYLICGMIGKGLRAAYYNKTIGIKQLNGIVNNVCYFIRFHCLHCSKNQSKK